MLESNFLYETECIECSFHSEIIFGDSFNCTCVQGKKMYNPGQINRLPWFLFFIYFKTFNYCQLPRAIFKHEIAIHRIATKRKRKKGIKAFTSIS